MTTLLPFYALFLVLQYCLGCVVAKAVSNFFVESWYTVPAIYSCRSDFAISDSPVVAQLIILNWLLRKAAIFHPHLSMLQQISA